MKRSFTAMLVPAAVTVALAAHAQGFQGPDKPAGGFRGPSTGAKVTTVAQAMKSPDNTRVVLTGTITSRIAGEDDTYIFSDPTGEIPVEIDDRLFAGRTVTPKDTVRLSGKVEKEPFEDTEVDVKSLEILK